jgi:hypothetical protein
MANSFMLDQSRDSEEHADDRLNPIVQVQLVLM